MAAEDLDFNYEVISPSEVDQIVAALDQLRGRATSQTIREFLEECSTNIHYLVHDDDVNAFEAAA